MGSISGEDSSGPPSAASSPKSRVKFLCSYGGKIVPRPADGHLKYVGGETRVLAVPRNITFSEVGVLKIFNFSISHPEVLCN